MGFIRILDEGQDTKVLTVKLGASSRSHEKVSSISRLFEKTQISFKSEGLF